MAKFRMWRDHKSNNYKYADRKIKSYFDISGTKMIIHKYIGTYDDKGNPVDGVKIQDLLFMETRDRRYSPEVFELMSIYEMSDDDFELSQFGFMKTDTLYLDFHMNEMVKRIGRKLSAGDVVEIIHLRDDLLEDSEGGFNTFFVVEEGRRPVAGYHANWMPHMWRIRVSKITDSPMYNDIIDNDSFMGILDKLEESNDDVLNEAKEDVPDNKSSIDYVYNAEYHGLITPPEDLDVNSLPKDTTFPMEPEEGDYVVRMDYSPKQVFQYIEGSWRIVHIKENEWNGFHQFTDSFVQNDYESCIDGEIVKERNYITNPLGIEEDEDDEDE